MAYQPMNRASTPQKYFATFFKYYTLVFNFHLIGRSLMYSQFPKKAKVTCPNNYRHIAISSALSKVVETVLNVHFVKYLECKKLLCDRQYGFHRVHVHSTENLMELLIKKSNQCFYHFGEIISLAKCIFGF